LNAAGVVAALAAEARALGPARRRSEGCAVLADGTLVAVSGIGPSAAGSAARRLIEAGATSLVSWGMAGGLDPGLEAGAVCLPHEVIAADGTRFPTARPWREFLTSAIAAKRPVASGNLLTAARAIDTAAAKATARRETAAAAVDMESSAVAQVAQANHLPFIAVRVIVDAARDSVPAAVIRSSQAGQVRVGRLLLGLMQSPMQIVPLLRLARRYRLAMRSLRAVAALGALAPPAAVARSRSGEA
jgi:adenosylhomocysteine nucleosidase